MTGGRFGRGPGRRWNAALLNLSGLSLGFLYLRRYKAAAWYLVGTALLVWIFGAGAAAGNPGFGLAVAVLWLAWMAWRAWRIGDAPAPGPATDLEPLLFSRSNEESLEDDMVARADAPAPPVADRRPWTATAVAAVLLAALITAVLAMRGAANGAFEAAQAAHETGDCATAESHYERIDLGFQLSFSGVLPLAAEGWKQCAALTAAREAAADGEYEPAVEAYAAYLAFPDPPGKAAARAELSEIHLAEAVALTEDGYTTVVTDLTAAIGIYAVLAADFGDTDAGGAAPAAVQALYDDGVAAAEAVGKCEPVDFLGYFQRSGWAIGAIDDAATELTAAAVEDATARLPGLLLDCGEDAFAGGDRVQAKALLNQLIADFPDDPNIAAAQAILDDIAAQEEREAEAARQREAEEEAERQREAEEAAEQARIDEIRSEIDEASSGGDNLADPDPAGSTGGDMELKIGNASGYTLEILYDGPETGSFTIGGCSDCTGQCTDGWAVWETVSLPAGEYEMVVKATDPYVTPYYGVWGLDSGTAYQECYYIESY